MFAFPWGDLILIDEPIGGNALKLAIVHTLTLIERAFSEPACL